VRVLDEGAARAEYARAAAAHYTALEAALRGPRLMTARLDTASPLVPQVRQFLTARSDRG
jgi:hypothetical protein